MCKVLRKMIQVSAKRPGVVRISFQCHRGALFKEPSPGPRNWLQKVSLFDLLLTICYTGSPDSVKLCVHVCVLSGKHANHFWLVEKITLKVMVA